MYDLLIIGGGISGMVASIIASRRGKKVLVLERAEKVGKKLLATGNGKGNLANVNEVTLMYNTDFVYPILSKYNLNVQQDFYKSIGLLTKEVGGRIYPYSEQASSVLNALRKEMEKLGVKVVCGYEVKEIKEGYRVGDYSAKNVLLATGSKATFGMESGFLYEKFGHRNKERKSALVPILTSQENLKGLRGVRCKAKASLYVNNRLIGETLDEVIFKDNGVSGTAVFTLSTAFARSKYKEAMICLDLMPEYTLIEVEEIIRTVGIDHLFHKEIVNNLLRISSDVHSIASNIKRYLLANARLGSSDLAQVMSGGLEVFEFNPLTLESKLKRGLYASGEVLDVDGECGGFNIMWAVASGMAVGENV
jgi:predicted Rossmann fold flavoprotein